MKRKPQLFTKCTVLVTFFILTACTTDLTNLSKDITLKQTLVIPVGEGTISVTDLLSKLNVQNISTMADTINFTTEINRDYQFTDPNLLSKDRKSTRLNSSH